VISLLPSVTLPDSLRTRLIWIKQHIDFILLILLSGAALIRFWAAPLSAGPDVAQFWAFAKTFQVHGLDFYRYADAWTGTFPYQGWGYFYPPVWLLLLRVALFFTPASLATDVMIDPAWRIAMKTPIIIADLVIGLLIYWAVPGKKWRKLLFASLWLFHPTAWYESAVFGQFDAIAVALLLACVITLMKGKDRLAFILAALAVLTKQHTFLAVVMIVIISARGMSRRRFFTNVAFGAGTVALFSIPFLVTGNFYTYARSLFLPGSPPGYQFPLCFSFSGTGSILTYLHDIWGWNTVNLISFIIPLLIVVLIAAGILCYKKQLTPLQGALVGVLIFTGIFYRINYQYLVIYIPLAILLASQTSYRSERIFTIILSLFPAVWIWLANVPWWFHSFEPHFEQASPILTRIGFLNRYLPDYAYVTYAAVLMVLSLSYVVLAFCKWHQRDGLPDGMAK